MNTVRVVVLQLVVRSAYLCMVVAVTVLVLLAVVIDMATSVLFGRVPHALPFAMVCIFYIPPYVVFIRCVW